MNTLPSDLDILNAIYEHYFPKFVESNNKFSDDDDRVAGAFMQIDVAEIANQLDADPNIVFGRLYYYLEKKYGNKDEHLSLFALKVGGRPHCVNMLYLTSIVSELRREYGRYWWTMAFTAISVAISAISLVSSMWAVFIAYQ